MKRFLPAIVLLLVLTQLFVMPIAASAIAIGSPAVTTLPATNLTSFSATLNGSVTFPDISSGRSHGITPVSNMANGYHYQPTATGYFRYGTSPGSLTLSTLPITLSISQLAASFSWNVVGLMPCTTYYFQAFVLQTVDPIDYQPAPSNLLVALLHSNLSGLGVGLDPAADRSLKTIHYSPIGGAILSFTTPGCSTPTVQHGTGSFGFGGTAGISNITVQTAAISSTRVGPGDKVDITATVANKGTVNGATRVTLYINGQEVESKGITLASGQSEPVHFFVTQNDPGTYSVQVGGVSAGSFTVDTFNNNDILIYGVIALFTLGIAGTLFMLTRKRPV